MDHLFDQSPIKEEEENSSISQERASREIALIWPILQQYGGKFTPKVLSLIKNGLFMPSSLISCLADLFAITEIEYESPAYAAGMIMATLGQYSTQKATKNAARMKIMTMFLLADPPDPLHAQHLAIACAGLSLHARGSNTPFELEMNQYTNAAVIMDTVKVATEFKAAVGNNMFASSPFAAEVITDEYVNAAEGAYHKALIYDSSIVAQHYNLASGTILLHEKTSLLPITPLGNALLDLAKKSEDLDLLAEEI